MNPSETASFMGRGFLFVKMTILSYDFTHEETSIESEAAGRI
jgi:hypothetical protein